MAITKAQKNIFPNMSVKDWNEWINHVEQTCEKQYFKYISYSADDSKNIQTPSYVKTGVWILGHSIKN